MNEFVASNGVTVRSTTEGVYVDGALFYGGSGLYKSQVDALREFFLAERDAELGRWRSKEHPEYVVYPSKGNEDHEAAFGVGLDCVILRETDGAMKGYVAAEDGWPEGRGGGNEWRVVAREYIAAHTVSKPWYDAKLGEVWVIEAADWGTKACIVDDDYFMWSGEGLPVKSEQITAGRRIYPEEQGVEL